MKREKILFSKILIVLLLILLIYIIFAVSFVLAQEGPQEMQTREEVISATEQAGKTVGVTEFREATGKLLSQKINIPEEWNVPARVIFGLQPGESMDLQTFVVLAAVWIILFILLQAILVFVPLFGEGLKSWIGAFVITCLISITGAVRYTATWFFGLGGFLQALEKWGPIRILFTLILLIILGTGAKILLRILKESSEMAKARATGARVAKAVVQQEATEEFTGGAGI